MREIKFRFWDTKEKKWMVDGCSETNIYDFAFKQGMNWDFITKAEAVDRVVVIQYTGVKDRTGREIYDGYICKSEISKVIEIVVMDDLTRYGAKHWKSRSILCTGLTFPLWQYVDGKLEIIGNRFENPELLEATKK